MNRYLKTLEELKTNEKWSELRSFYRLNFTKINDLILNTKGTRSVNEDIQSLNEELINKLFNRYRNEVYSLMKDINTAIKNGKIKEDSL